MVWVRIDDQFPEHPKVAEAGPLAMAMQVAALCYCNRKLTDGFVPRSIARRLLDFEVVDADGRLWTVSRTCGMVGEDVDATWVIELLVEAGMWDEVPGGYAIHDYHDFQPTKEDVEAERESARERMRNLRAKRKGSSGSSSGGSSDERSDDVRENFGDGSATPVPVPKGSKEPSTSAVADPKVSEDARTLTREFAHAVKANGFKVPSREQRAYADWLTDMDRLLRLGAPGGDPDPQTPDDVRKVIQFATTDSFWRANIGSPSKFREQYPKLRLRMLNEVDVPRRSDGVRLGMGGGVAS